jgi:peptidyl-prolyl cis-trans isomerase SurA
MNKNVILSLAIVMLTGTVWAQKKSSKTATKPAPALPVKTKQAVFSISTDTVYEDEFMRQFMKNRREKEKPTEKELQEYLNLYVNFKLKVKEAKTLQLDTNPSFINELAGYRKQLAAPYLNDKNVTEALMQEAYERMKSEVNASHILLMVSPNASPADTLAAYNKLMDIRRRALKGESFDSLALKHSEDPSAKDNMGKLGWFTVFQMVYPFESVAYKTNKNEISMPFRTQFGYHLVKVNDKRPARGEVKLQHIMIRTGYGSSEKQIADAKAKADEAYAELLSGVPFESVVEKYSQDDGSKANKGIMNWVASLSGYPNEFKDAAFALKENEISKPFATDYGWHIIKLLERRPVGEFKEVQDIIKNKITRDSRSEGSKTAVINRVKRENNYREFTANINEFIKTLDTSFLAGKWKYNPDKVGSKPVFTIGNVTYNQRDFAEFLSMNQQPREKENIDMVARNMFNSWADERCLAYEESILENKYEDFRNIMNEYHDGILLFDLTDKKVWGRAVTDTAGLEAFWKPRATNYMWKERISYNIYNCKDSVVKKAAFAMALKGKKEADILKKFNTKKEPNNIIIREVKAEQSDNIGSELWDKKGAVDAGSTRFYVINGKIAPEAKSFKEARGLVTSDYQEYLMNNWIAELKEKYPVWINEAAIKKLAE